ncbi:MAG: tRNA dihydrouridine synthase DusB [Bacillota bacterium]
MVLKIGPLKIQPGLALAPMAGVTSHPFRVLAGEQGCQLFFSEMISARGLIFNNRRTESLLYFTGKDRPIGIQLFGSDPEIMARAAARIEKLRPDFIDLNLGCPTRKITKNGEGGALLLNPSLCSNIFKAVVKAVSCPVTVKVRKGWDEQSVTVLEIANRAEDAGLAAITVHGRTVKQGYSGRADWEIVREIKAKVSIPIIGNGDIDTPYRALEVMNYSGCDGVMIGRAARGNPWIFAGVNALILGKLLPTSPTVDQIVAKVLQHFKLLAELKGEAAAARAMRKHSSWYIRGLPGAAVVRQKLIHFSQYNEFEAVLLEFAVSLNNSMNDN